jgi:hypothetical protein
VLLLLLSPAGIVEGHAFVLFMKLKDDKGSLTYYIPVLSACRDVVALTAADALLSYVVDVGAAQLLED